MRKKKPFLKFSNLDGIPYEFYFEAPAPKLNMHGFCESPEEENPRILVDPSLPDKKKLNIILHEYLHYANYSWSEANVKKLANNLTKLLYKSGWRLTEPPEI